MITPSNKPNTFVDMYTNTDEKKERKKKLNSIFWKHIQTIWHIEVQRYTVMENKKCFPIFISDEMHIAREFNIVMWKVALGLLYNCLVWWLMKQIYDSVYKHQFHSLFSLSSL